MKRCSTCLVLKPATLEYFYRDTTKRDGLTHDCKPCRIVHTGAQHRAFPVMARRHQREFRMSHQIIRAAAEQRGIPFMPKATEKRCPRCGEVKPLTREYFYRDLGQSNGFQSHCKPCDLASKKTRREKQRVRSVAGTP